MRLFWFVILGGAAACGGAADDKPTPYRHADPVFVLDVPAGYTAGPTREDPGGGTALDFQTTRSSHSLSVSWRPGGVSPADARAEWKTIHEATDERSKIVGEGELAGGGTWIETDYMTSSVHSWLKVGDVTVHCFSSGGGARSVPAALVNACKTLRPAP